MRLLDLRGDSFTWGIPHTYETHSPEGYLIYMNLFTRGIPHTYETHSPEGSLIFIYETHSPEGSLIYMRLIWGETRLPEESLICMRLIHLRDPLSIWDSFISDMWLIHVKNTHTHTPGLALFDTHTHTIDTRMHIHQELPCFMGALCGFRMCCL